MFLNAIHKNNYLRIVKSANMHTDDVERKALFYIIAGNEDLFTKKNSIYDFKENSICLDILNSTDVDFCSSSKALVRLGFNLYNGYTDNYTSPLSILNNLDSKNYTIADSAINIRFNR